jgi:acid phosphatase class B
MVLKETRAKVEKAWTTTKKIVTLMMVWGLIFSLVSIARLGAAFAYDDTLVDSSASYAKAASGAAVPGGRGPDFWKTVNQSYDLESPKLLPYAVAGLARAFGFHVLILAERQAMGGEALKKEWRALAPRGFTFVSDPSDLHLHLQDGRYVLFLGSTDRELLEARKAGVYAVRVKRGRKAVLGGEYSPGRLGEVVLPLSEF